MNVGTYNVRYRTSGQRAQAVKPQAPPSTESKGDYQTSKDLDWVDAGNLMKAHDIEFEGHSLLRENLATYLAHRTEGIPSQRWQNKIDRELKSPYTDGDVFKHIETLEDSLQANLSELQLPAYPSKVYITGSFAKGRLGANSDLDGFAAIPRGQMSAGFDSYEKREANPTGANLFPLADDSPGYARGHLMFSGQSVEMTPEQLLKDGSLSKAYSKILETRSMDRRETSNSFEWITGKLWGEEKTAEEKREAFESNSLKTRIQNTVMAFGGTLSTTPLVGPAVNWIADKFAAQRHLDLTEAE